MEVEMLVVQGKQRGHTIKFPEGEFIFGRGPECHLRSSSDWVSRQHCALCVGPKLVSVKDLGSTNGTLVNGERVVGERQLAPGDQLQFGALVLQMTFDDPLASIQTDELQALQSTEFELPRMSTSIVPESYETPVETAAK